MFATPVFLPEEQRVLETVRRWWENRQNGARQILNVIAGDFIQWTNLVRYAIDSNTQRDATHRCDGDHRWQPLPTQPAQANLGR
jgi:hypothetical protein